MKNFTNKITFLLLSIIFLNCSGGSDDPNPVIPPDPGGELTQDNLIGNWEIYFSKKDLILLPERTRYEGFRNPEMDGFLTKFYKENGSYKFINYNPIKEVIDEGTYTISDGYILFNVEKFKGKDSIYVTKQNVTNFDTKNNIMSVNYTYNLTYQNKNYEISDIRRLRSVEKAPNVHPNVEKLSVNFDDYVGTWQVYDYIVLINYNWDVEYSKSELKEEIKTSFKFYYDNDGQKKAIRYNYDSKTNQKTAFGPMPVLIIDDVIHMLFRTDVGNGVIENDGWFLWVTDRKAYLDPDTNNQTEMIRDSNEGRYKDNPVSLYQTRRYFKKVE